DYIEMLKHVMALKLPTTTCTIYNPNYPDTSQQQMCTTGLSVLNDVIVTESTKLGIPVIDLKTIFNNEADYANAIEPDMPGGDKITDNMILVVEKHDFSLPWSTIYAKIKEYDDSEEHTTGCFCTH
ncbi:unnamed protein product, partial [Didymodactylos carnosus]